MKRALLAWVVLVSACGDDAPATPDAAAPDAAPDAPEVCPIQAPGSRCASATTLERCNGVHVETVDCAADGALCGPDTTAATRDAAGSACIKNGQACGWIGTPGACSGPVLARCEQGMLNVSDCSDRYAMCVLVSASAGYDCRTVCEQMNVDPEGRCVTGGIRRCVFADGQYSVQTDACPAGTSCQTLAETGWPACLPQSACAGVGPEGRCDGNRLVRCQAGTAQTTDCTTSGQVCGFGGGGTGYTCAAPGAMGAFAVSGVVRYEDRAPLEQGGLGPITPAPARGITVAVVQDADGRVVASAVTADDGSYMLRYDASAGTMVHVLAATTAATTSRPIRVTRPDGLVHGFGSTSFAAGPQTVMDILVSDRSAESEAFNIFDQAVSAMDFVRAQIGVAAPTPLLLTWVRGGTDGTYYQDSVFLLGSPEDDDGYDDTVILHEIGHYIEDKYGRSDSPGGAHDGSPTDPRLAWSEGFATYWEMAVRGSPLYMDSNADGGWSYNADTIVTAANMAGPMSQPVSEDTVTEILWDVTDQGPTDDDPMTTGSAALVLAVEHLYLTGSHVDRGVAGVDLVDWLDGWFVRNDLTSCNALRSIVTTTRRFPYDFAGPAGTCP